MKRFLIVALALVALSACGAAERETVYQVITNTAPVEPEIVYQVITNTAPPETDTPSPTDTPRPTDSPAPTDTPRPTNTLLPPTDTPQSTATLPPRAEVVIVDVFNQSYKENVTIANRGTGAQDMSGWSVTGSKGDERYTFPDGYILAPGASVKLHSGEGGIDAPPTDIYWTDKTVWNNQGETVYLWDAQGNLVHSYSYP